MTRLRAFLGRLWAEPAAPGATGPRWWDLLLAGLWVGVWALEVRFRNEVHLGAFSVWVTLGLVPTILWRRTRPLLMVLIAFGAGDVLESLRWFTDLDLPEIFSSAFLLMLPYAVFRWGSGRAALIGGGVMMAGASRVLFADVIKLDELFGGYGILLASMAIGLAVRSRDSERRRQVEQAKLQERESLARDLHDTVAHHVSAIAIRAQAGLAVAQHRPEAAAEALEVIAGEASRTLAEMRAIVRTLRGDEAAELRPGPKLDDVRGLAGPSPEGPTVQVEIDAGLDDDLSDSVATAVFRLAQESVTNARRHARGARRVLVRVEAVDDHVRLHVEDDGERVSAHAARAAGFGLIGMRERAEGLGGRFEAGPGPERGWTVTAILPRTPGA